MTIQDLDFTGGPWKLRNGMRVKELFLRYGLWVDAEGAYNLDWDSNGNAHRNDIVEVQYCPEFDIVENLDNWKYNRKGE